MLRFDGERALFESTDCDPTIVMKPRLAEVQRLVKGEITTAALVAAIREATELGKTQAEGLIYSAHAAGLIRRVKRGVWGPLSSELPF